MVWGRPIFRGTPHTDQSISGVQHGFTAPMPTSIFFVGSAIDIIKSYCDEVAVSKTTFFQQTSERLLETRRLRDVSRYSKSGPAGLSADS